MFTDPMSILEDGDPRDLARININGQSSIYRSPDEKITVKVSHQTTKNRTRRLVRFEQVKSGVAPLTGSNADATINAYLVIDEPSATVWSDSSDNVRVVVENLIAFLTGNTGANLAKVLGSEI